jgi:hypothetical protein
VAVKMEYQHSGHTTGSGSHNYLVPEGLMHFGYTDAEYYSRANVNDDVKWREMICNEIDNRRPIEYAGASPEGGHAFILDGYNSSNQYHFNWGWGGSYNGWFAMSALNPTASASYNSSKLAIIGIQPDYKLGDVNRDGNVNITDAMTAINQSLKGTYSEEADVNSDGKVTVADGQRIINHILHKDTL